MQLPALAALAQRLFPSGPCRFVSPDITPASEFRHLRAPLDGRGIDEVQAAVQPLVAREQPGGRAKGSSGAATRSPPGSC